ncbi:hypothetical protein F5887DRAFT_1031400 [Amanita rubescens]|nr:hypothetical protein F5887DRAFT_1031400 [Amanita rubescens]
MHTTQIVMYDSVPIIRRRLEEALRREAEADPQGYRKGVFIYHGMKSALVVPVLRKPFSVEAPVDVGDSFWAVDSWIAPPATSDVPLNQWTKNIKITETHALFYYSLKSGAVTNSGHSEENRVRREEAIGDILYLRLQGGQTVNIEDEEAQGIVRLLPSLL